MRICHHLNSTKQVGLEATSKIESSRFNFCFLSKRCDNPKSMKCELCSFGMNATHGQRKKYRFPVQQRFQTFISTTNAKREECTTKCPCRARSSHSFSQTGLTTDPLAVERERRATLSDMQKIRHFASGFFFQSSHSMGKCNRRNFRFGTEASNLGHVEQQLQRLNHHLEALISSAD